jgi:UDP-N-acetylmuramyl pentapeptide phosphotransferase/UDP-N-acetylglucosamine-1-phosphate transferase
VVSFSVYREIKYINIVPHAALAPLLAFVVTLVAVRMLASARLTWIAVDRPNERSLHDKPVPRIGGLGLHAGVLLAWPVTGTALPAIVWLGAVAGLIVSFADDIYGIPIPARLSAHLLASGLVAAFLLPDCGPITLCIAMLGIAWLANLYNFMDGADGIAGGMAVFGFSFYAIAAWLADNTAFAALNGSIAAAALAFLVYNFHPARIFMGDAGSVPLGFLAGCIGLIGWQQNDWPWWFPLLVFSPFIVDASVTLLRRTCERVAFWRAHRDHYYQRLVQMGWGHRRTAFAEYVLMLSCGIAALSGLGRTPFTQYAVLATAAAVYAVLIIAVEIAWRNRRKAQHDEA